MLHVWLCIGFPWWKFLLGLQGLIIKLISFFWSPYVKQPNLKLQLLERRTGNLHRFHPSWKNLLSPSLYFWFPRVCFCQSFLPVSAMLRHASKGNARWKMGFMARKRTESVLNVTFGTRFYVHPSKRSSFLDACHAKRISFRLNRHQTLIKECVCDFGSQVVGQTVQCRVSHVGLGAKSTQSSDTPHIKRKKKKQL